jgi:post-segregation antitoxin (ccd killing protein)
MTTVNAAVTKRPVNVSLNSDLLARARREGLNLSALARIARERFETEIAQACEVHE